MIKWNLRKVMAEKGIWSGQDLVRLLEEKAGIILSHNAVMALVKKQPRAVRFTTLEALCVALDVQPWDLIEYTAPKAQRQRKIAGEEGRGAVAPYKRKKEEPEPGLYPEEEF